MHVKVRLTAHNWEFGPEFFLRKSRIQQLKKNAQARRNPKKAQQKQPLPQLSLQQCDETG